VFLRDLVDDLVGGRQLPMSSLFERSTQIVSVWAFFFQNLERR
jgi:hypothetical protein